MSKISNEVDPCLVELFGFPGSGKTSIARYAVQELRHNSSVLPFYYGKHGKLPFRTSHFPGALALCLRVMRGALHGSHARELTRMARAVDSLLILGRARLELRGEPIVLFDQAVIQKLYLMRVQDQVTAEAIESALEVLEPELSDFYVMVDTPPDVAAERFSSRNKRSSIRPFKRWSTEDVASLYGRQQCVLQWMADWFERSEVITLIRLDGQLPIEENGQLLAREIERLATCHPNGSL